MPLIDPLSMSTPKAKPSSTPSMEASKPGLAFLHPIAVASTPISKGVAFARPATILGLLAVGMGSLVEDTVWTLTASLPLLAFVQVAYCVVCLPLAGSPAGKASKKMKPGEKKKHDGVNAQSVAGALLSLVLVATSIPIVYILFVLFGAPFLDHTAHTVLCAAHFAVLALQPVLFVRGLDKAALMAVAGAAAPLDETFGGLAGAVLGAWLGAIPIPLDWDRDWQQWPVTIVVGMYIGSCMGIMLSGTLLYGWRLATPITKKD